MRILLHSMMMYQKGGLLFEPYRQCLELVPLRRLVDELQRLAGVLHVDGVQLPLQVGDLLRLDEDAAKTRDLTNWILRFQYSSTTNFIDTFL